MNSKQIPAACSHYLHLDFFASSKKVQIPVKTIYTLSTETSTTSFSIHQEQSFCASNCDCACSIQS